MSIKIISRDKDRDFIKIKRTIIRKTTLIHLHAPDEFKNTWSKKKKKSNEGIDKSIIKFKDLKVALSVIPNTCIEKSIEVMSDTDLTQSIFLDYYI